MTVPSPNILLALFILSFSLSAIFHRSTTHSGPTQPSVFSRYAADILVPSTNDTFASRPAAFGGVFDSVLRGELVKCWGDGLACTNWDEENDTLVTEGNDSETLEESAIKLEDEDNDRDGSTRRSEGSLEMDKKNRFMGKIVLVQRGKCAFAEKVRRVQEAGGIAVVVGDNTPSSGLLTMYAKGTLLYSLLQIISLRLESLSSSLYPFLRCLLQLYCFYFSLVCLVVTYMLLFGRH